MSLLRVHPPPLKQKDVTWNPSISGGGSLAALVLCVYFICKQKFDLIVSRRLTKKVELYNINTAIKITAKVNVQLPKIYIISLIFDKLYVF